MHTHLTPKTHRYVSCEYIAEFLGLSTKTLDRWRSEKRNFPYYHVGGAVRYDIDEVLEIIQSGRIEAGLLK